MRIARTARQKTFAKPSGAEILDTAARCAHAFRDTPKLYCFCQLFGFSYFKIWRHAEPKGGEAFHTGR